MSQIPQRHFLKHRSSQQGKTWTSLHVCFSLITANLRLTYSEDMPGAAAQDSLFDLLRRVILRLARLGMAT